MMFLLILYICTLNLQVIQKMMLAPQSLKIEKENIICKDGFCTLPNQNQNQNIIKNNVNLFDPI